MSPTSVQELQPEVPQPQPQPPSNQEADEDAPNQEGDQHWLTIRRRCELCKQRKVRLSNSSASGAHKTHNAQLYSELPKSAVWMEIDDQRWCLRLKSHASCTTSRTQSLFTLALITLARTILCIEHLCTAHLTNPGQMRSRPTLVRLV